MTVLTPEKIDAIIKEALLITDCYRNEFCVYKEESDAVARHEQDLEALRAFARSAALRSSGLAIVPVEPTDAMIDAGDYECGELANCRNVYRAMRRASEG